MAENTYQDELVANYEQLREQRDWSPAQMAEHLEGLDPSLAAEYRSRHVSERSSAPKARKSASSSKSEA